MKFWNHSKYIEKERLRYDLAASPENSTNLDSSNLAFSNFPVQRIRSSKQYYSRIKKERINVIHVLEIGVSTGQHTRPILTPFTKVTAIDISERSLEVL